MAQRKDDFVATRYDYQPWMELSRCRALGLPASDFYPERYDLAQIRAAQKVCLNCSVRLECLQYAVTHGIEDGIWGGTRTKALRRLGALFRKTGFLPPTAPTPDDLVPPVKHIPPHERSGFPGPQVVNVNIVALEAHREKIASLGVVWAPEAAGGKGERLDRQSLTQHPVFMRPEPATENKAMMLSTGTQAHRVLRNKDVYLDEGHEPPPCRSEFSGEEEISDPVYTSVSDYTRLGGR
jgi:WhiB family redox-sensing transcriptional regulator